MVGKKKYTDDELARRRRYMQQRWNAKVRGIEWKLTFEEWDEWWGEDFYNRGHKAGQLNMCRVGDTGAYELGNIYKDTAANNAGFNGKRTKNSPRKRYVTPYGSWIGWANTLRGIYEARGTYIDLSRALKKYPDLYYKIDEENEQ